MIPPNSRDTDDPQNLPVTGPKSPVQKRESTNDHESDTQVCGGGARIVAEFFHDNERAARLHDSLEAVRTP